jgi:RNA polymerase sigma-70 factor (ECF subfamily)
LHSSFPAKPDVKGLYERYGPLVHRRCAVILRDPNLAADAFQETFVKVMTHQEEAERAEHKLRWLYRVADRTCLDTLRKRRRAPYDYREVPEDQLAVHPGVDPDEQVAALRLLQSLDPDAQQMALMAFVDGMTQDEIGKEIGVSRVTVNKRLQAIREAIRNAVSRSDSEAS